MDTNLNNMNKRCKLPDRLSHIRSITTSTILIAAPHVDPGPPCLRTYLLTCTDDERVLPALSLATAVSVWVPEAPRREFLRARSG